MAHSQKQATIKYADFVGIYSCTTKGIAQRNATNRLGTNLDRQ